MTMESNWPVNTFCLRLYNSLSTSTDENLVISPVSVSMALSMVYAGASDETSTQLKSLLNLSDCTDKQIFDMMEEYLRSLESISEGTLVSFDIANKMFVSQKFKLKSEFKEVLTKSFESDPRLVDFSEPQNVAHEVNSYVAEKTNSRIQNLVSSNDFDSLTNLVLVNTIYFKGKWKHPFVQEDTHLRDFRLNDGSTRPVEMMCLSDKRFEFKQNLGELKMTTCKFLYKDERIAMTVILPDDGVNIDELEKGLSPSLINEILSLPGQESDCFVYLPKFNIEVKTELSETLIKLGASDAFDPEKANFKGLSEELGGMPISKAIHHATISVDEEGTEAGAATAVTWYGCMLVEKIEFECNRPFLFIIHDSVSNGMLFMGKFMKPNTNIDMEKYQPKVKPIKKRPKKKKRCLIA